jgi:hypothetical protein
MVSPCRPLHFIRFHGVLAPNARLTAHRDHLCKVEVVAKSGSTTVPKSPITEANSKAGGLRGAVRLYSVYRQVTYGAYTCSRRFSLFFHRARIASGANYRALCALTYRTFGQRTAHSKVPVIR